MSERPSRDKTQAEAIRDLLRLDWTPLRIRAALRIGETTYKQRVRELRAAEVSLDPIRPTRCAAS
jgi:ribosomal protein L20